MTLNSGRFLLHVLSMISARQSETAKFKEVRVYLEKRDPVCVTNTNRGPLMMFFACRTKRLLLNCFLNKTNEIAGYFLIFSG